MIIPWGKRKVKPRVKHRSDKYIFENYERKNDTENKNADKLVKLGKWYPCESIISTKIKGETIGPFLNKEFVRKGPIVSPLILLN